MKVLIGYDGSEGADVGIEGLRRAGLPPQDVEALVVTVAEVWLPPSPDDEVRVVVAQDLLKAFPASLLDVSAEESADGMCGAGQAQAEQLAAAASEELRAGLGDRDITVSSVVDDGPPKQALVRLAEEFGADCIFTGATGFNGRVERFLLGSVSAAVAARAHCSVEVVRS
jgi:nucleotide-binding universal stress UspA family protein